ncbi:MAG: inositol monophosphatase family protein [Ornithinimicrobium sp.]
MRPLNLPDPIGEPASYRVEPGDWPDEALRVELRELAVELAIEAGRFVRDQRPAQVDIAETKATVLDVVTVMDTEAEAMLRRSIAAERASDGVLGEEDGHTTGTSGLTWVLDPIDGTVNYLYDIPAYAVSVAVVVGDPTVAGAWTPVAGAVFNPGVDEIFDAHLGGGSRVGPAGAGSYPRARALQAVPPASLATALVGTGFSYDTARRRRQGLVATQLLPQVRDLRRIGAASLDLCAVGAGRLNAYFESGLKPWDMAAGALIAAEAGAVVNGLDGPPDEAMVLAAPGGLYADLRQALARAQRESEH